MKMESVSIIVMNDELLLERLIARYKQNQEVATQLRCLFEGSNDSPVLEAIWGTFQDLSNIVAEKLGDRDGWIDWFIWEADCGAKFGVARVNGVKKHIKTVTDLLWAIRGVESKI